MSRKRMKLFYLLILISFLFSVYIFYLVSKFSVEKIIDYQRNLRIEEHQKRKTIPQIVGHYVGIGGLFGNISADFMNTNNFSPVRGVGENGDPVVVPTRDILKMQQLFQINRYNLLASDRIALNRSLPDVRKQKCIIKTYPRQLPTTSIIIVFHNEAWSVLLRTVWSVINRSPKDLLKEILLVDDASERSFLKAELENYVQHLPVSTKILRLKKREGLVAARLLGANIASGDTLTFLDAHCECSVGWLEPLLTRVKENRRKVVCPVIDIISDDNFSYIKSFEFHWGAFNWELHFRWYTLGEDQLAERRKDTTEPFHTPLMAGGLFTIDKDYFFEIGSYDEQLKIWGGDNLEMSFRIWQCGGEIEIAPCSHVGHLFRKSSPYTFPGGVSDILNENLARVALVWMDGWTNFFFKFNKGTEQFRNLNISTRESLRKDLKCKSFQWYLNEVWPQNFFPDEHKFFGRLQIIDSKSTAFLEYRTLLSNKFKHKLTRLDSSSKWNLIIKYFNENLNKLNKIMNKTKDVSHYCLQRPKSNNILNQPFGQSFLKPCTSANNVLDEQFLINNAGIIMSDEGICLDSFKKSSSDSDDVIDDRKKAKMVTCGFKMAQKWEFDVDTLQIRNMDTNNCLESGKYDNEDKIEVLLNDCDNGNDLQKWILLPVNWK